MTFSGAIRRLELHQTDAAAEIHRAGQALIPGYDVEIHTLEEQKEFYRDVVFPAGPIWGAFREEILLGHIALLPGWIDHLYVSPEHHGQGIGRTLITLAQRKQNDLQLWTFQSNGRARIIYEKAGFVAVEFTDGSRNEERQPDVRFHWQKLIDS